LFSSIPERPQSVKVEEEEKKRRRGGGGRRRNKVI
jgi:hypothetical protein